MSAEEKESVPEEVQEAVAPAEAEDNAQVDTAKAEKESSKSKDKEFNFAEMRRVQQEIKKENQELKARLESAKPQPKEEDFGIEDSDLVEGRHIKELKKEIKSLREFAKQRDASETERRIKADYPDFSEVVSAENIELLKQQEPELALSISRLSDDPLAQAVAAYKLLKKTVLGTQNKSGSVEKEKALKNLAKPQSSNSASVGSSLENAHLFDRGPLDSPSKETKARLWKETQEFAKRA